MAGVRTNFVKCTNLLDSKDLTCVEPLIDILCNPDRSELKKHKKEFGKLYVACTEQLSGQIQASTRSIFLGIDPADYSKLHKTETNPDDVKAHPELACPPRIKASIDKYTTLHEGINKVITQTIVNTTDPLKSVLMANFWLDVIHRCFEKNNLSCVCVTASQFVYDSLLTKYYIIKNKSYIAIKNKKVLKYFASDIDADKILVGYLFPKSKFETIKFLSRLAQGRAKKTFYVGATLQDTLPPISAFIFLLTSAGSKSVENFVKESLTLCREFQFDTFNLYKSFTLADAQEPASNSAKSLITPEFAEQVMKALKVRDSAVKAFQPPVSKFDEHRRQFVKSLIELHRTVVEVNYDGLPDQKYQVSMFPFLNGLSQCVTIREKIEFIDKYTPKVLLPVDKEDIAKMRESLEFIDKHYQKANEMKKQNSSDKSASCQSSINTSSAKSSVIVVAAPSASSPSPTTIPSRVPSSSSVSSQSLGRRNSFFGNVYVKTENNKKPNRTMSQIDLNKINDTAKDQVVVQEEAQAAAPDPVPEQERRLRRNTLQLSQDLRSATRDLNKVEVDFSTALALTKGTKTPRNGKEEKQDKVQHRTPRKK